MTIHHRAGRRVSTSHVYPPIPDRSMDWSAIEDGVYDCDCDQDGFFSTDPIGRGPTEEAAIADLLEQLEDAPEMNARPPLDHRLGDEMQAAAERARFLVGGKDWE